MPRLVGTAAGNAACGRGAGIFSDEVGEGRIECDRCIYELLGDFVGNGTVLELREGVMVKEPTEEPTEEGDKGAKAFGSNGLIS